MAIKTARLRTILRALAGETWRMGGLGGRSMGRAIWADSAGRGSERLRSYLISARVSAPLAVCCNPPKNSLQVR